MRLLPASTFVLVALLSIDTVSGQAILYVDHDAPGRDDGSNWVHAYNSLQNALALAAESDRVVTEIRVAQGIYTPDNGANQTPGDREATFQLMNGVAIKGGYAGFGQPDPDLRDIALYKTVLSGDLNGDDGPAAVDCCVEHDTQGCEDAACEAAVCSEDRLCCRKPFAWDASCVRIAQQVCCDCPRTNTCNNSYHVVTGSSTDRSAVLDGFTITAGRADGETPHRRGAGMLNDAGSPTLIDCTFVANVSAGDAGGGMYNSNGSSPILIGCAFERNVAGGMFNSGVSDPVLINCVFRGNSARSGGGMANVARSSPALVNCVFERNSADWGGAMFLVLGGSPTITNTTFARNTGIFGGGAICAASGIGYPDTSLTVRNCIFWGNRGWEGPQLWIRGARATLEVAHSNVEGGLSEIHQSDEAVVDWGLGNLDVDPMFMDIDSGVFHLGPYSPCRDAGDNDALPADVADLDGDGNQYEPLPVDLDYSARVFNGVVDMGAYEYQLRAMFVAALDIMPEMCPNRLNRQGRGQIRVALLGTWSFDVTDVDIDTLVLTRADGEGGEVRPIVTPSGLEPRVKDVATAVGGESCNCNKPRRDGTDDLVLWFESGEIIKNLRLNSAAAGDSVTLTLTGSLFDGRAFEVSDCVVAVGREHEDDRSYRKPR